jgi:class 3 adenylate cyclase/HEAT repeat protein
MGGPAAADPAHRRSSATLTNAGGAGTLEESRDHPSRMKAPQPAPSPSAERAPISLGREGKVTALTLLKNYYDEEIFSLLVKPIYDADLAVSEAAIRASGSPGNEVAVQHLYQIIERGKREQRLAAIQSLAAIRAPTAVGMLIKYFNHFSGEDDVRTAILGALNTIAPSHPQVQELDQAVLVDARQGEEARRIAVEALVEAEKTALLLDALPRTPATVQEAAFARMLRLGGQEVPDFTGEDLPPGPLGAYLCLYTLKAESKEQVQKQPQRQLPRLTYQPNWVLESLQRGQRQTVRGFLLGLTGYQGRVRFPSRLVKLLLVIPFVDVETEGLVGDFLKRIVDQMKKESPQLLTEFSETTANRLEKVFARIRQTFISVRGITRKDELLMAVLASLLERYASPAILAAAQTFFRDESPNRAVVGELRSLIAGAPREDRNRFEACVPLFQLRERKDRLAMANMLNRVDLDRPLELRRLNRLIRAVGALEIRTSSHKVQEILEFARAERVPFLEETAVVTLCQLLSRTAIEQSREVFRDTSRSPRSLAGYVRGARFMPSRIMIGPLVHLLLLPKLDAGTRVLAVESLERMDLSGVAKSLPPLLKTLEADDIDEGARLRIADVLAKAADAGLAHLALDLTGSPSAFTRRAAVRVLRGLCSRGAGVSTDTLTERLYRLLEDTDQSVRRESLLGLLAIDDDYAAQVVTDEARAGRSDFVAELLTNLPRPLSRETFALARSLLAVDSAPVQAAIRTLASELCQGAFAEEMRQALVRGLVPPVGAATQAPSAAIAAVAAPSGESIFAKSKLAFKFQRSYVQELTVLFVDIERYTEKTRDMKPKEIDDLVKAFEGKVVPTVYKNRGTVVKKMGDAILAVFKHPVNAVIAAMMMQQEIEQYSSMRIEQEKIRVRIGINTGQVTWKDNDIFGPAVNAASRLQTKAPAGGIWISEETWKQVREYVRCTKIGTIEAKGLDPITAYAPEEIVVDLGQAGAVSGADRSPVQAGSLERLRASMFVPEFRVPDGKADRPGLDLLRDLFGEIAQAVGDILSDSQEYDFKKFLQERWNDLMSRM